VAWFNLAQDRDPGLTCMTAMIWERNFIVLALTLPYGISSLITM